MDLLVGGLAIGGVYALLAIGVVLVFRATGVVNFAQGEVMMVGAYGYVLAAGYTGSAALQMAAAILAGMAAALTCCVVAHVLLPRATRITQVIGTIGVLILL
jgi:branched-subunit amino acid ABC-type transport system permease component